MLLISWNIDSLNAALTGKSDRALLSRQVLESISAYQPEVLALQETKLPPHGPSKQHQEILENQFPDYTLVWNSSVKPARTGYSGTLFLYRKDLQPQLQKPVIGAPDTMDLEGRIITLDFESFYLTQVYTPNAGDALNRLQDRQLWDQKYADYLTGLDQEKPVLAAGDFNVAHREIDLARPKENTRSAGFTIEERTGFSKLLDRGFVDSFRHLHGDVGDVYTWWAQRSRTSKTNNTGWRIDYWLVSERLAGKIIRSEMIDSGPRQDHTPILLEMDCEF